MYVDVRFSQILSLTIVQERTHKGGKSSLFDRMVNQLSTAAATAQNTGGSTTSAQAAAAILRYGGLSATVEKQREKALEEPVTEEDGQLHIVVAETMLKWHAEAVGRCVELSAANDVYVSAQSSLLLRSLTTKLNRPKHIFSLLRVLAAAIGSSYLETAVETYVVCLGGCTSFVNPSNRAQTRADAADPKLEPNLQPLVVLRGVDLISHLWQQYVNIALLPLASSSVTVRREMVVFNNQTISRIEGAVNHVLQKLIDSTSKITPRHSDAG